jgi:hypothetical protein
MSCAWGVVSVVKIAMQFFTKWLLLNRTFLQALGFTISPMRLREIEPKFFIL